MKKLWLFFRENVTNLTKKIMSKYADCPLLKIPAFTIIFLLSYFTIILRKTNFFMEVMQIAFYYKFKVSFNGSEVRHINLNIYMYLYIRILLYRAWLTEKYNRNVFNIFI